MICQFDHEPCQYIKCPLWDEGRQRCLFHLAILKILEMPAMAPGDPSPLTRTQSDILSLISMGRRNSEIAEALSISQKKVSRYIADLMVRLDAKNRAHAVTIAVSKGIISFEKDDAKTKIPG